MTDWERVREDFPVTKNLVYFISAGLSPVPTPVLERVIHEYRKLNEYGDIHWVEDIKQNIILREKLGAHINTGADNLAILQNTSSVMSVLALSLKNKLGSDFNVVSMMDEFPSTTVPFEYQGIQMKYVEPVEARYSVNAVLEKIDENTAAVLTSYVQYGTGFRQDIKTLGDELKKRGILFLVNATQGFPFFPIDVQSMQIDAMAASLHKWGFAGQIGSLFFTSRDFRKNFAPPMAGWLSVDTEGGGIIHTKKGEPFKLLESADRYIQGCYNLQTVNAIETAFDYLSGIGFENIRERIFELSDYLLERLEKLDIKIISPVENRNERSASITFSMSDISKECVQFLEKKNICVAYRAGNIRVSLNIFNTKSEIDLLIRGIEDFLFSRK